METSSVNQVESISSKCFIDIEPLTEKCSIPSFSREHICIGISPFNSLFSEEYIRDLINWSLKNFRNFHLFLPDEPTYYTLEALGYDPIDCRRKMKKQLNWLKNKIEKAISANGLDPDTNLYVLGWDYLSQNEHFKNEYSKVMECFENNEAFRNSCMEASKWVLQNRIEEHKLTEKTLMIAVKYFLSEIPLFAATNKIVGCENSLFCYHQSIDFHKKLYEQKFHYKPQAGQGYGVIKTFS